MRDDAEHIVGVGRNDVIAGDPALEAERRALDRRRDPGRADIGQHIGDVDGVLGALLRAPVRLVDLLLHRGALEVAVDEGVGGVDVHVVVAEKFLQLLALGRAVRQRLRRTRRQPDAHAERLVAGEARLHLGQIGVERRPQLLPIVGGMHQRRIGQMAEAVTEIHFLCFLLLSISVILRCERSEPRRATARAPRPHPSRPALRAGTSG